MKKGILAALTVVLILSGCATSDPLQKLTYADNLIWDQYRPLPAERLIIEAMEIYQEQNDSHGLGKAYAHYGDFLLSPAVDKWSNYYRENGFRDKSVTFGIRVAKSKEYFTKAMGYYQAAEKPLQDSEKFDALTNLYFNMAWVYYRLDDRKNSCEFYDKSLAAYKENIRRNPTAKPQVASGYKTPADQIADEKKRAGCEANEAKGK